MPRNAEAVLIAQAQVQRNQVHRPGVHSAHQLSAVRRFHDAPSFRFQSCPQDGPDFRLVLRNDNSSGFHTQMFFFDLYSRMYGFESSVNAAFWTGHSSGCVAHFVEGAPVTP
jgi:hypothetical protein